MKIIVMTLFGFLWGIAPDAGVWPGKVRTDRSITLSTVVDCAHGRVFELWTTVEGVKAFFAPDARIDARIGGGYEMIFRPETDPSGATYGTKGAKILAIEDGRRLTFEWNGRPQDTEMNVRPLPTWVEIRFERVDGAPDRTRVSLAHHGFGAGGTWDDSFEYFDEAWGGVLDRLKAHCGRMRAEETATTAAGNPGWRRVYYVSLLSPGRAWARGVPAGAQDGIGDHVTYMRGLAASGTMVLGGPFADQSGRGMAVFDAASVEEARVIATADPAVKAGLFDVEVHPWMLSINNLEGGAGAE